ncbi:ADP-ribosylglycohydrolase family protein [Parasphingorhabdus pacifica]
MTNSVITEVAGAKARGVLLGAAMGDALGAAFEGRHMVDDALLLEHESSTARLHYTDDTAQTLVLARHLLEQRDQSAPVAEDVLARDFARAWHDEPWRGYGAGSRRVLGRILDGADWSDAARECFSGHGSYGNGGAMRVAPVAVIATGLEHASELARRTARVTHAHPDGEDGAVLQACAVYTALHTDPSRPLDRGHFLDQLNGVVRSTNWQGRLDRIRTMSTSASPSYAAEQLGNDTTAINSVPMALHAFLQYPDRPVEAIRHAIRAGGDTDTIASMAGAMTGARTGINHLPAAWLERLEDADRIRDLADELARPGSWNP